MFNVGLSEFLVIAFVAMLVLGPDKLPTHARKVGNLLAEVRRMSSGLEGQVRSAVAAPSEAARTIAVSTTTEAVSSTDAADDDLQPVDPTGRH